MKSYKDEQFNSYRQKPHSEWLPGSLRDTSGVFKFFKGKWLRKGAFIPRILGISEEIIKKPGTHTPLLVTCDAPKYLSSPGYRVQKGKQNFNNNGTEVSVPTLDLMWKDLCPPTAICFFMTLKWLNRQMRRPALCTRKLKSTSSHVNLERIKS